MGLMQRWANMVTTQPHKATKSGNPLSVYIAGTTVEQLLLTFLPSQSGSGTPSASNVRTISGKSSLSVTIDSDTHTTALGSTYYGGTLDVKTGVLTVDWKILTLDGTQSFGWYNQSRGVISLTLNEDMASYTVGTELPDIISDKLRTITQSAAWSPDTMGDFVARTLIQTQNMYCGATAWKGKSSDTVKTLMAASPVTIAYKIATPITVSLTPETISGSTGMHTITTTADTATITCYTI